MAHPMAPLPRPLSELPLPSLARVRAVATDIDETLTERGLLTPAVLAHVARLTLAGVEVLLVTGRPAGHTVGLVTYLPGIERAVAENGGVLLTREGARFLVDVPVAVLRSRLDACEREVLVRVPDARLTGDRFARSTDATFHVEGLSLEGRAALDAVAHAHGFTTVASSMHVHVLLPGVSKGVALERVCRERGLSPETGEVVTVGDSLTDAPLFDPERFPLSVGVANLRPYLPRIPHAPAWITAEPEGRGFGELARRLVAARSPS